MLKWRNIGVALALALMLCITMLGSGAFAHNNTNALAAATTGAQAQLATQPSVDLQRASLASNRWELNGQHESRWIVKCGWHGWGWRRQWKCYRHWRL
ncbi:MAG: hypothetical protein ACRDHZ_13820 [Ktedonobacteraceae bacterium]